MVKIGFLLLSQPETHHLPAVWLRGQLSTLSEPEKLTVAVLPSLQRH